LKPEASAMSARITEFLSFNNQPKIPKQKMMEGISIKTNEFDH